MARLTHEPDGPHIGWVWTDPRHRRKKIASELIGMLLDDVREHEVFVWVIHPNPDALKLYESLGFERTKEYQELGTAGRVEERLRLSDATSQR
jgi:ribosomal protein S18 acetylase RimI-like enzyme